MWSIHCSTSANRSLRNASPLTMVESGQPTRCGLGNSRDRPLALANKSKMRSSSLSNSSRLLTVCVNPESELNECQLLPWFLEPSITRQVSKPRFQTTGDLGDCGEQKSKFDLVFA